MKPDVGVFSPKNKQVFKIASFWHGIAKMSQKMRDRYPSRVFTVNSSTMFKDAQVVNSLLNWLSIEHRSVTDGRAWTSVANSNRKSIVLSPEQKNCWIPTFFMITVLTAWTMNLSPLLALQGQASLAVLY